MRAGTSWPTVTEKRLTEVDSTFRTESLEPHHSKTLSKRLMTPQQATAPWGDDGSDDARVRWHPFHGVGNDGLMRLLLERGAVAIEHDFYLAAQLRTAGHSLCIDVEL